RTAPSPERACETPLTPPGLAGPQYRGRRTLGGSEADGWCRNGVGTRLVRPVPDVARLLDRLEAAKLVGRQRGGEDRCYVVTRITKAGLRLLDQVQQRIEEIHEEQLGHLDEAQLRQLVGLLAVVRERG